MLLLARTFFFVLGLCALATIDAQPHHESVVGGRLARADTSYRVVVTLPRRDSTPDTDTGTHEPSSMTLIHEWNGHGQGAWLTADGKPMHQSFAFDSALHDTVMVQTYGPWDVPPGQTWGPGHLYFPIPAKAQPLASFYVRAQIKLSPNWKQPPGSGDQKLFQMFPSHGHGYNVGLILLGPENAIRFTAYENNGVDSRYNGIPLGQNPRGSAYVRPPRSIFTLNEWHTIEVLVIGSTPGVPDGKVITWLDGAKQMEVDDMMWVAAGENGDFIQFDINSLWGGQGGRLSSAQYMYVGKVRLSGRGQRQ